jgi:hypothetical protein
VRLRWVGIALIAMMPFHVALRPEHGWLLLSGCDVAAMLTAVGLVASLPGPVGVGFLFQVAIGLPAFAIGLFTTYPLNPTGTIIHLVPPLVGGIVVARHGLPPRAALYAWFGAAGSIVFGYLFAPRALNINFACAVWPPLAHVFTILQFQLALLGAAAVLLATANVVTRKVVAARPPPPAAS